MTARPLISADVVATGSPRQRHVTDRRALAADPIEGGGRVARVDGAVAEAERGVAGRDRQAHLEAAPVMNVLPAGAACPAKSAMRSGRQGQQGDRLAAPGHQDRSLSPGQRFRREHHDASEWILEAARNNVGACVSGVPASDVVTIKTLPAAP